MEGCDHMTCPICKYEWCWICGMKYKSYFHMLDSTFCNIIGNTYFKTKRKCFLFLIILIVIFFPIVIFTILFLYCFYIFSLFCDKIEQIDWVSQYIEELRVDYEHNKRWLKGLYIFMAILGILLLFVILVPIALVIATVLFIIGIIPSYVLFFIVLSEFY